MTAASARTGAIVTSGRMVFRYADHDEVFEAGDAYYGAPGHLPLLFAGTEVVEFSPTDALNETMAVVGGNLEAAKASGQLAAGLNHGHPRHRRARARR